jgi:serine/threonine-protein kinase
MGRFLKGLGVLFALAAVGIASAAAVVLLLRQEEVSMPDLTGRDIVSVIEIVTQHGLQLKVDRREPHPDLPRDTVISQSPAPGSGIKKGRQVRVIISQGPSEMQAPKLTGEHFRKADMMIRQAGFSPGEVSRVASEQIERDTVIAQDPPAGSPLERGGVITVLVSAGKKARPLVMPKFAGKRAETAVRIVERMGLQHRVISRATPTGTPAGGRIVVGQKPAAGHPVGADALVELVVSR